MFASYYQNDKASHYFHHRCIIILVATSAEEETREAIHPSLCVHGICSQLVMVAINKKKKQII